MDDLYGLTIIRRDNVVKLPKEEKYDTLPRMIRQDLTHLIHYVREEIRQLKELGGELRKTLTKAFRNFLKELSVNYQHVLKLYKYLKKYAKCCKLESPFTNIGNFMYKHRGLFLYTLHEFHEFKTTLRKIRNRRFQSLVEVQEGKVLSTARTVKKMASRLKQFNVLFSRANFFEERLIFQQGGEDYVDTDGYHFLYGVDFRKQDKHFDFSEVYGIIGGAYYDDIRQFFQIYISAMAGFANASVGDTSRELDSLTPSSIPNKMRWFASVLYYSEFPEQQATKIVEYVKSPDYSTKGYGFWRLQDDPLLAQFIEFALEPIALSDMVSVKIPMEHLHETILSTLDEEEKKKEENKILMEVPEIVIEIEDEEEDEKNDLLEVSDNDIFTKPHDDDDNLEENQEENELKKPKIVHHANGSVTMDSFKYFQRMVMSEKLTKRNNVLRFISPFQLPYAFTEIASDVTISTDYARIKSWKRRLSSILGGLTFNFVCGSSTGVGEGRPGTIRGSHSILFHVHGGGFHSGSSHSQEPYLRSWATDLGIAIFSVDYTNAPTARFPAQPKEIFLAYKFVVEHAEEILGFELENIFIGGDSAGGNLATSLTSLIIGEGFRVPDGLIIHYPSLMVSFEPTPSRLMSYFDVLVSKPFLIVCLESYAPVGYEHTCTDPFLSPVCTPVEVLRAFPPTLITACSLDPLLDDALSFAKKLYKYSGKRKVKLTVYDGMAHGYLALETFEKTKEDFVSMKKWMIAVLEMKIEKNKLQEKILMEKRKALALKNKDSEIEGKTKKTLKQKLKSVLSSISLDGYLFDNDDDDDFDENKNTGGKNERYLKVL